MIRLGTFDEESHLQWLDANPGKRPKKPAIRKHISHYYSGGDICDVTSESKLHHHDACES